MKLLTLPFLLLTVLCFGQNKIGNLTVDNMVFKEYLFDCYNRPDTLTREYVDGCGEAMEREVKVYNEWLSNASIRHIVVEITHPVEVDTIPKMLSMQGHSYTCPYGSIKHEVPYFSPMKRSPVKGYKEHEKDFEIMNEPEWIEKVEIGFAVPRKPSEIDFIKYLKRTSK